MCVGGGGVERKTERDSERKTDRQTETYRDRQIDRHNQKDRYYTHTERNKSNV